MTIIIFIIVLFVLVLVHEFGHFLAAKFFGMKVEEFGIGFPPRIVSIKKGETRYSLNFLPLGGFVKILGEEGEGADDPRSYSSRPAWQKSSVLVAGVVMNFLLAVGIFWITFTIGYPATIEKDMANSPTIRSVQILDVAPQSPAKIAGIEMGDTVIRIMNNELGIKREMNHPTPKAQGLDVVRFSPAFIPPLKAEGILGGSKITNSDELQTFINKNKGKVLTLVIKRGDQTLEKTVLARKNPPKGEGSIGISLADVGLIRYPWYSAFFHAWIWAFQTLWFIAYSLFLVIKTLFTQGRAIGEVAGPIGLASMVGKFYSLGISYFFAFVGTISLSLSFFNTLPIPALDGGHLLFVVIEKVKGSPVKRELEQKLHTLGFAILLTFMLIITIHDILKL